MATERRVHLQAILQKASEARLRSCSSRGSNAMATIAIAPDRCNSELYSISRSQALGNSRKRRDQGRGREEAYAYRDARGATFMARGEWNVGMSFVVIALHCHIVEAATAVHAAIGPIEFVNIAPREGHKNYEPKAQERD